MTWHVYPLILSLMESLKTSSSQLSSQAQVNIDNPTQPLSSSSWLQILANNFLAVSLLFCSHVRHWQPQISPSPLFPLCRICESSVPPNLPKSPDFWINPILESLGFFFFIKHKKTQRIWQLLLLMENLRDMRSMMKLRMVRMTMMATIMMMKMKKMKKKKANILHYWLPRHTSHIPGQHCKHCRHHHHHHHHYYHHCHHHHHHHHDPQKQQQEVDNKQCWGVGRSEKNNELLITSSQNFAMSMPPIT